MYIHFRNSLFDISNDFRNQLIDENAALKADIAKIKAELESEVILLDLVSFMGVRVQLAMRSI